MGYLINHRPLFPIEANTLALARTTLQDSLYAIDCVLVDDRAARPLRHAMAMDRSMDQLVIAPSYLGPEIVPSRNFVRCR